jgi:hypothetical protein
MRVQFLLLGAVVALTFGALSYTSMAPVGSISKAVKAKPSPEASTAAQTRSTTAPDASAAPETSSSLSTHPCNHGFYMSQVAHQHKGGKFVSQVAKSDLGKNGDCSKPVPTPTS